MRSKKPAVGSSGLTLIKKNSSSNVPKSSTRRTIRKKSRFLRYPLTDYGNAERLIALFGQDIHYHSEPHSWFAWDGKRWKRDRDGFVQRLTKQTARTLYAQAVGIKEKEDRDQCNSFARRSENARGIRDALECARSIKGVTLLSEQLDTDPFLLNCTNGTLDLRTGELREHRRGTSSARYAVRSTI